MMSPSLPTFYSYFLAISKNKLKRQLPNKFSNHVQKNQHPITEKCFGPQSI